MILISESLWGRLLDGFAETVPGVERVAFLDGVREGDIAVVTTVAFPDAILLPGTYDVSAEAMSRAGQHLRENELSRLAQVHTHGMGGCHHSSRDDEMAYTQRENAVSIVLPYHAAARPTPTDGVIHVRTADSWVALEKSEAKRAVRLVPSYVDQRSQRCTISPTVTQEPLTGFWRRLMRLPQRP